MKNKNVFIRISMVIFMIILLMPLIFIDTKTVYSKRENRKFAEFPSIERNGRVNWRFFNEFDAYIKDRFGFRYLLIAIDNQIGRRLFNSSGSDRVLLGKRGWLYYTKISDGDNYSDFMKQNLVSEKTTQEFVSQLKMRFDWCKENNIKFIFLIAPNKHSVYPENYPFDRPTGLTRAEQLLEAMDRAGMEYIYPKDDLIAQKTKYSPPLYYLTDTHWNELGAWLAFSRVSSEIKKSFPSVVFPEVTFDYSCEQIRGNGELAKMIGQDQYGMDWHFTLSPHVPDWMNSFSYIKNDEKNGVFVSGINKSFPKAIVYRDSFFTALVPFVSTMFSEVEYHWKVFEKNDKEEILDQKPDVIIWEVAERYLGVIPRLSF